LVTILVSVSGSVRVEMYIVIKLYCKVNHNLTHLIKLVRSLNLNLLFSCWIHVRIINRVKKLHALNVECRVQVMSRHRYKTIYANPNLINLIKWVRSFNLRACR